MTHDVAIIGAGPIGLELAVALKQAGIEYLVFDSGQIGETIFQWPPNTHFFSSPERIAIAGVPIPNIDQTKITGEAYLAYLRSVAGQFDVRVNSYEQVETIRAVKSGPDASEAGQTFELDTRTWKGDRQYRCRNVVLATGGMAGPRLLGIPGEDLPHVSHFPADPHRYFQKRVLIVGGRNTAFETALRLFRAGAQVTISYRRDSFDTGIPKQFLVAEVRMWMNEGKIAFFPATIPVEITADHVVLAPSSAGGATQGDPIRHETDFVLLCTGFVADMRLFEMLGVELQGDARKPVHDPGTMETNVPGVFVAGTATAGTQERFKAFIETGHVDVERITVALKSRI
jgi:thioredoxin reductase (NADPH)